MRSKAFSPAAQKLAGISCASLVAVSTLALPSAYSAQVYNKDGVSFDIFGSIQAAYVDSDTYKDIAHQENDNNSIYASGELGISGRSNITHGLDGIMMAMWEATSNADGSSPGDLAYTRYMYAGLDAYQYGTLLLGKADNAYYSVAGVTDIFNVMEGHASDYYLLGDQKPASIMYSLRALSWDLKLSYMMTTHELGDTPLRAQHGMAASLSTKFGKNVTFAYGIDYYHFDFGGDPTNSEKFFAHMLSADGRTYEDALKKSQAQHVGSKTEYGASLSYGVLGSGLYAALYAGATKYDYMNHHIYTVDTALNYAFDNGLSLSLGYGLKHYDGIDIVSELGVGVAYKFTPAFTVFAEGQFDLDGEAIKFYGLDMTKNLGLNENKFAFGAEIYF